MRALLISMCLLLAAACGGDDDQQGDGGDGPEVDGGGDPGDPDGAPVGTATVTATVDDLPAEGVHVFFNHPDGQVAASGQTDADGTFAAEVAAGSTATALVPTEIGYRVVHFTGVEPGDQLHAVVGQASPSGDPVGNVTVELPGAVLDATLYWLADGCIASLIDFEDGSHQHAVRPACADDIRVLAYARDDANNLLAFSGGSAAELGATIELPDWRTDWTEVDLATAGGAPGSTVYYQTTPQAAGRDYLGPELTDQVSDDDGASALTVEIAAGFFDSVLFDIQTFQPTHFVRATRRVAEPPASWELDLAADVLPPLTSFEGDSGGFTWTAPAGSLAADGIVLAATFGVEPNQVQMVALAPVAAGSLAFPEVPPGLPIAPFPAESAARYYDLVEADFLAGFADFRRASDHRVLQPATGDFLVRKTENSIE